MPALWNHTIDDQHCNGYGRCELISVWILLSPQHSMLGSSFTSQFDIMKEPSATSQAWSVTTHGEDTVVTDQHFGLVCAVLENENAPLIAAAPDLLGACYAALELHCPDRDDHDCGTFVIINEAIAKAEGK